jgi:polyferredoxin
MVRINKLSKEVKNLLLIYLIFTLITLGVGSIGIFCDIEELSGFIWIAAFLGYLMIIFLLLGLTKKI